MSLSGKFPFWPRFVNYTFTFGNPLLYFRFDALGFKNEYDIVVDVAVSNSNRNGVFLV